MEELPKNLTSFIFYFLKKQWKWFLLAQLFCFGWSIDHTFWPVIIMNLIDTITTHAEERQNAFQLLSPVLISGACLWILVELCFRFSGIILAKIIPRFEAQVRMAMLDYVLKHSYSYFNQNFSGSIANKIADMAQSLTHILQLVMSLFLPVLVAISIAIYFFALVQWPFAFILGSWIIAHMTICFLFATKCDALSHQHAEARSVLAGNIVDSLTNQINVKLFARHSYEMNYVSKFQKTEQKKHRESLWYIEKMKIYLGITAFLVAGILLNGFLVYSWQHDWINAGEVIFIFNTSWNITMMAWIAGLEFPTFFKEIGVAKQALTIIQAKHSIINQPGAKELKVANGNIIFDKVTFNYSPGHTLFYNKTVFIKAGEKVGLVGFSGSGKTSFINLILRHFDLGSGRILIDGQDISEVTLESLHRNIAVIPQDATLFHRSLMENIRYGSLEASDKEVIAAAKKAHCHDFIENLPLKYETLVGERGTRLSGGQRQRISIARAILKNAPILILDEATSALDSVTEKHIQEDFQQVMAGRTAIVVAHRLSTIANMDRILVFDQGRVVEEGSHEQLLAANGFYAKMWKMQAGGFLPDRMEGQSELD
ncbi:MAG: ABC transporter ATP-binding protein [Parachlamydiaceae bacterium]